MASQVVAPGAIAAKLGRRIQQAHEEHKNDEIKASGFGSLPEGIDGGVAELRKIGFGVYKDGDYKGEFFFMAQGVIRQPLVFKDKDGNTHNLEGKLTKIGPEPLCETPTAKGKYKTLSDHWAWIRNHVGLLGGKKEQLTPELIESVCLGLENASATDPIYFNFRTWKGKPSTDFPNPRVNEEWEGRCEFKPGEQLTPGFDDQTPTGPATPSANGAPVDKSNPNADGALPDSSGEDFDLSGVDLDQYAKEAVQDGDKQDRLTKYALSIGCDNKAVEEANSWDEVVALIRAKQGGKKPAAAPAPTTPAAAGKEFTPKVKMVFKHFPINKKTGKPMSEAHEVVVRAVDTVAKTVKIQSMDDPKKEWDGVPWDQLKEEE